jgi:hypothetical protein
MGRFLGRTSLIEGILCWSLLALPLVFGGLDPSPTVAPLLKIATLIALCAALLGLCFGIVALIRRQQRASALAGLALSVGFLLYFTGFGFALFAPGR